MSILSKIGSVFLWIFNVLSTVLYWIFNLALGLAQLFLMLFSLVLRIVLAVIRGCSVM